MGCRPDTGFMYSIGIPSQMQDTDTNWDTGQMQDKYTYLIQYTATNLMQYTDTNLMQDTDTNLMQYTDNNLM